MGRKKTFEDRAAVIAQAAEKLFLEYGFERTTAEDIAKAAGISKASLYLEYNSKEAILERVIVDFVRGQVNALATYLEAPHANYCQAIRTMLTQQFLAVYDHATAHTKGSYMTQQAVQAMIQPNTELEKLRAQPPLLIAQMLQKAAANQEILPQADFTRAGRVIYLTVLRVAVPPYHPDVTRDVLAVWLEDLLTMLLAGLKVHQTV
jgi:AcrR family transcriptional regulator